MLIHRIPLGPDVELRVSEAGYLQSVVVQATSRRPKPTECIRIPGTGEPLEHHWERWERFVLVWFDAESRVAAAQVD